MKTQLKFAILLASAIGFAGAAASAQTLKAEIPFRFQTSNTLMPPGSYTVSRLSANAPVITLSNWQARKSVIVMASGKLGTPYDGRPRLTFRCAGENCALSEIWGATGNFGFQAPPSHLNPRDQDRLSVVYLERAQSPKK